MNDKYSSATFPTIPADEPVFVLRAQDACAIDTLHAYVNACEAHGASDEHLEAVDVVRKRFMAWQRTHSTKVPD